MKLRFDLVEKITPEMLMESVLMNNHRYSAESHLAKTGVGSLSPASAEDLANEAKFSAKIIQKIMGKPAESGNE
jgi:hypothetical protein